MTLSSGTEVFSEVIPVVCNFDTTGSDLTIYTPKAGFYAGIIGMVYQASLAHTITFKSGTVGEGQQTLVTLNRAANDGAALPIGMGGLFVVTQIGKSLVVQCGTAVIGSIIIYVAQFKSLRFGR